MKRKLMLGLLAMICFMGAAFAQGGMQRQTPEERTKATMDKLASLTLSADQNTKVTAVFSDFYATQQKAMEDMRAAGTMDRDAMMAKRKELSDARDAKLKEIFSADQYTKWTNEIEPSMRPQRKAQ